MGSFLEYLKKVSLEPKRSGSINMIEPARVNKRENPKSFLICVCPCPPKFTYVPFYSLVPKELVAISYCFLLSFISLIFTNKPSIPPFLRKWWY